MYIESWDTSQKLRPKSWFCCQDVREGRQDREAGEGGEAGAGGPRENQQEQEGEQGQYLSRLTESKEKNEKTLHICPNIEYYDMAFQPILPNGINATK